MNAACRFISKEQADARQGPGLCTHGDVQPGDRSDAWTLRGDRGELERTLINYIRGGVATGGKPKVFDFVKLNDGRIVQFAVVYGYVFHRWQSVPNGGFGQWVALHDGQPFGVDSICGEVNKDGRVDIVAWGPNGSCYRTQGSTGGNWRAWRVE